MAVLIDPVTRDYVLLEGMLKRDPSNGLLNSIWLRLQTPLGTYWADKTIGSKLHLLRREKDVARVQRLAQQYAEQALEPILIAGRATSITVTTEQLHNGRMHLLIEVVAASGETLTFKHPVKVI